MKKALPSKRSLVETFVDRLVAQVPSKLEARKKEANKKLVDKEMPDVKDWLDYSKVRAPH